MNSEFADKLQSAIKQGRNNVKSYIWKGPKVKDDQGVVKQEVVSLMDATETQLKTFYKYCNTMLYNTNVKNIGRVPLLESIQDIRDRCGVELFYRDSEVKKSTRFVIVDSLRTVIKNNDLLQARVDNTVLGDLISTHKDYQNLPINLVIEGGLDKLGRFDSSHITFNFIIRQGVWLVKGEKKEYITLKKHEKLSKIKTLLKIRQDIPLELNPITGLSIAEMKIALTIGSKKYSDLTSEQLNLLRTKLLFALEDNIKLHISQWEGRKAQIQEVADIKGYDLK